jgi:hypothetical protein
MSESLKQKKFFFVFVLNLLGTKNKQTTKNVNPRVLYYCVCSVCQFFFFLLPIEQQLHKKNKQI